MSKEIAVAGREFYHTDEAGCVKPRGRVCAFAQSFHTRDIVPTARNNIQALINNAIAWANITKGSIAYFDTENDEFNTALEEIVPGSLTKLLPWYEAPTDVVATYGGFGVYILFPNYNALKGNFMPDVVQQYLMTRVKENGAGLVLSEWFHFMQSLDTPSKRSFSFHGDGTIVSQGSDETKGLFTISPFAFDDFIDLSKPSVTLYQRNILEDDMSYMVPFNFDVKHTFGSLFNTTNYNALFAEITSLQPDITELTDSTGFTTKSSVFYYADNNPDTTIINTTTSTAPPVLNPDIKFKVAEISEDSSCGPLKRTLVGQHANLFELEDNDIYLIKRPESRDNYNIQVRYEDLFSPKRFDDFFKNITIPIRECGTPLSEPVGDYKLVWGYKENCRSSRNFANTDNASSFVRIDDYDFSGEGTPEIPVVVELGGEACSQNVMWIQVNEAGTLSYDLTASSDCQDDDTSVYCVGNSQINNRTDADWATVYLASGVNLYPRQHNTSISSLSYGDSVTLTPIIDPSFGIAGRSTVKTGVGQGYVINFNPASDVKVFILLAYSKDESISLLDDRIRAKFLLGTTPEPDPKIEEFTVLFINRIPFVDIVGTNPDTQPFPDRKAVRLLLRSGAAVTHGQSDPLITHVNDLNVSLSINPQYEFLANPVYTIIPSDSPIGINVNSATTASIASFSMPIGGGSATVYIDGEVIAKTTTTPPPRYTYSLVFKNFSATTRFSFKDTVIEPDPTKTYVVNYQGQVGTGSTKGRSSCSADYMTYQVLDTLGVIDNTREYRDDSHLPFLSITDHTFSESTATHKSCDAPDIKTDTFEASTFKYCTDNDASFNISDGISVSYGRSCNSSVNPLPIRIDIPDIPDGGETVYIRIDGLPVATTPPPPTTAPPTTQPPPKPPCDDIIYVQCEQTLDCSPTSRLCRASLSTSTNTLKFVTCCGDLTEATIISRVYTKVRESLGENSSTVGLNTETMRTYLEGHYANQCPAIPTEAFVECQQQESNNNCVDQIGVRTIDAVTCYDPTYNPLP